MASIGSRSKPSNPVASRGTGKNTETAHVMAFDLRTWLQSLSDRVITDQDSEQEKLNKQLLIFASALMGFAAMVWVAIYQAMGIRFSSTVPLSYMVISAIALALYLARTNIPFVRRM